MAGLQVLLKSLALRKLYHMDPSDVNKASTRKAKTSTCKTKTKASAFKTETKATHPKTKTN